MEDRYLYFCRRSMRLLAVILSLVTIVAVLELMEMHKAVMIVAVIFLGVATCRMLEKAIIKEPMKPWRIHPRPAPPPLLKMTNGACRHCVNPCQCAIYHFHNDWNLPSGCDCMGLCSIAQQIIDADGQWSWATERDCDHLQTELSVTARGFYNSRHGGYVIIGTLPWLGVFVLLIVAVLIGHGGRDAVGIFLIVIFIIITLIDWFGTGPALPAPSAPPKEPTSESLPEPKEPSPTTEHPPCLTNYESRLSVYLSPREYEYIDSCVDTEIMSDGAMIYWGKCYRFDREIFVDDKTWLQILTSVQAWACTELQNGEQ